MLAAGILAVAAASTSTGTDATVEVAGSVPFDDDDHGSTPDDGWTAKGQKKTGTDQTLYTTAICADSGSYRYVS